MKQEGWLRNGFSLPDGERIDSLYVTGSEWQIYMTEGGGYALAVKEELYKKWERADLVERGMLLPCPSELSAKGVTHGETRPPCPSKLYTVSVPPGEMISSAEFGPFPANANQVFPFARALRDAAEKTGGLSLADGIYISTFGFLLPTWRDLEKTEPDLVLGRWLSGGMNVPVTDTDRMKRYVNWLSDTDRNELLLMFGLAGESGRGGVLLMPSRIDPAFKGGMSDEERAFSSGRAAGGEHNRRARMDGPFQLAGSPVLETFFKEEILDVVDREEEYRKFGVGFPGPTLLYGPPGSGKTFAVEKLAEYLGWPVFRITTGSVGSKYVHETGRKVEEIFDAAIRNAPSLLIIDELEAFLSERETAFGSREIHLEEVGVFLRRIPDAAANRVLLFGMTNMLNKIDPAILRTGRFDHKIEVPLPGPEEVLAVLKRELKDVPTKGDLSLDRYAHKLSGRPLSDVTFAVREAGRICVKRHRTAIDDEVLGEAISGLTPKEKPKRKFGF